MRRPRRTCGERVNLYATHTDYKAPDLLGGKGLTGRQATGATCWAVPWDAVGENMARSWGSGIEELQTSVVKAEK